MKNRFRGACAFFVVAAFSLTAAAAELERGRAEDVGMSSARLKRLSAVMDSYVADQRLAGTVMLVARRGKIVHFDVAGQADLETDVPMDRDAIFRIYSMTKPVTSVALMMLFEEGRFQLDDPVSKYLPELANPQVYVSGEGANMVTRPASREVTIRDLMSHQSGYIYGGQISSHPLAREYDRRGLLPGAPPEPGRPDLRDLSDFVTKLGDMPLAHDPGASWSYGVSVDVQGRLIEVLSGMTLDQFFEQRIFRPLGMRDTAFWVSPDKVKRLTASYSLNDRGRLVPIDPPSNSPYTRRPSVLAGGGGLLSTATDYARFCQMLLNGGELDGVRILGPKTLELMTMNHIADDGVIQFDGVPQKGYGFGLGFSVVTDVAATGAPGSEGTYFWAGYASTEFWIDPKEDLYVVFMTQLVPGGTYPLRDQLKALVYQAITGE